MVEVAIGRIVGRHGSWLPPTASWPAATGCAGGWPPAGWARSGRQSTRSWTGRWRSSCSATNTPRIPASSGAFGPRPAMAPRSPIPGWPASLTTARSPRRRGRPPPFWSWSWLPGAAVVAAGSGGTPGAGPDPRDRRPGRAGGRGGPSGRAGPPGHQAGQPAPRPRRYREGDRLWRRPAARRRPERPGGAHAGHGGLSVAGAGQRPAGDRGQRPVPWGWWPMSVWPAVAPSPVSIRSRSPWPICCSRHLRCLRRFRSRCGRWWPRRWPNSQRAGHRTPRASAISCWRCEKRWAPQLDVGGSGWCRLRQGGPADRSATTADLGFRELGQAVDLSRPAA
jgi:hypothetical protein